MENFVHLHLHSEYSLLDGVGKIEDYMKRAKALKMKAIALTDHGNMFGALEFYQKAHKYGIKPILGLEAYVTEAESAADKEGRTFHLVLLAENQEGYRNLLQLTSKSYLEGFYYKPRVDKKMLEEHAKGIIALSACLNGEVATKIMEGAPEAEIRSCIQDYQRIFGKENFFLEVQAHPEEEQQRLNASLLHWSQETDLPLVATNDVHYVHEREDFLQDVILCIQTGSLLRDPKRMRIEMKDLFLKTGEEMRKDLGPAFEEALLNTTAIAERCNLYLPMHEFQFPDFPLPEGQKSIEAYLRELCYEGLHKRYPLGLTEEITERVEYELSVILSMGYAAYFVVVWDFIAFARSQNIPIGPGRGSAAGSLVAYALEITQVDPLEYELIFERFLNPERISMPDIDIDICQERRQEIIDYVFQKYGRDRVAQIVTFGTLKARAAIRDVGRVMEVPLKKVDALAKCIPFSYTLSDVLESSAEFRKMYQEDLEVKRLVNTAMRIENKVRHTSTHAAGIVVTKNPLVDSVPLYADNKNGMVSTQYQMKELEELGLLKIDFLGLRNLTILQRCREYIQEDRGEDVALDAINLGDAAVYQMLSKGDSLGVFQMESRGLRRIMQKLRPNSFRDIIALLSLYRPGPLASGMVEDFIARKHGEKEIVYPHPSLEEILEESYGVILYQEQVMKIAHVMADYSLGEADLLRRAMGKKNLVLMRENREKFVARSVKKGYDEALAEEVFALIDKFAGYGFNKSHSAAYSMIAYWTAYFKCHYPEYFYAALLTSEISDIDKISFYIADAKRHGVVVRSPDVQHPSSSFRVQGGEILFALSAIKNIGQGVTEKLKQNRKLRGPFKSFPDFVERMRPDGLNKKGIEALIQAGALDALAGNRKEKMESLEDLLQYLQRKAKADAIQQMNLFGGPKKNLLQFKMKEAAEYPMDLRLEQEKEVLGFYVSAHPLDAYAPLFESYPFQSLRALKEEKQEGRVFCYGILEQLKKIQTKKGQTMAFADLEDYGGRLPLVIFPRSYEESLPYILEKQIVFVEGQVQIDFFRGEEEKKLLVDRVFSLESFLEQAGLRVYLRIEEGKTKQYESLKEKLLAYKGGRTPLYYALEGSKGKHVQKSPFSIHLSIAFLEDMRAILGGQNVKLR